MSNSKTRRTMNYATAFDMYYTDAEKFRSVSGKRKEQFLETSNLLVDATLPAILKNTEGYEHGLKIVKKASDIMSPVLWGSFILSLFYPAVGYPIWTVAAVSSVCCILKSITGHEKLRKAEDKNIRIGQELSNLALSPKYMSDLMRVNNIKKTVDPFGYVELVYKGRKNQISLNSPVDDLAEKGVEAIFNRQHDEWEF